MLDRITWFWQSALRWQGDGLTVYIDPREVPDDAPPADLLLLTHAHGDHFEPDDIARVTKSTTKLVAPHDVAAMLSGDVTTVAPGESHEVAGVRFTTVPAYNIREEALDFHPKANNWVGYLVELEGRTYYHAGDTDHLPELESVRTAVAFVPVGGYYTMDVPEAAELVRAMAPQLAVPFHYGFVVGSATDGERFREQAAPVAVEVMTPTSAFERE